MADDSRHYSRSSRGESHRRRHRDDEDRYDDTRKHRRHRDRSHDNDSRDEHRKRSRDEPADRGHHSSSESDFDQRVAAAGAILRDLLRVFPALASELHAVLEQVDAGGRVLLSGIEDPLVRTGLEAFFVAMDLHCSERDGGYRRRSHQREREPSLLQSFLPLLRPHPAEPEQKSIPSIPLSVDEPATEPASAEADEEDEAAGPLPPGHRLERKAVAVQMSLAAAARPRDPSGRDEWMLAAPAGWDLTGERKKAPKRVALPVPPIPAAAPAATVSMLDMCRSADAATKPAARAERVPFDRERDMQSGPRAVVDAADARQRMGSLSSRFKAAQFGST